MMSRVFLNVGCGLLTLLLQSWMMAALWIDGAKWVAIVFLMLQLLWWGERAGGVRFIQTRFFPKFGKSGNKASRTSRSWRRDWFKWTTILTAGVLVWWLGLKPSEQRHWAKEYERKPRVRLEGSRLTIENFRDFSYAQAQTVAPAWRTFEASLDDLISLDLFLDYWGSPHIAHPMLSFGFRDGQQLVFSIETRRETHETYSAVKGFFRQFELIYLAGSESDLLNLRVHQRQEDLYWYPLTLKPETIQKTLMDFVRRCQELEAEPEFYHAITSNCSTNLRSQSSKFRPWDYRVLINGWMDEMLHERGLIVIPPSKSFADYKSTRWIDRGRLDRSAQGEAFSKQIRQSLNVHPSLSPRANALVE